MQTEPSLQLHFLYKSTQSHCDREQVQIRTNCYRLLDACDIPPYMESLRLSNVHDQFPEMAKGFSLYQKYIPLTTEVSDPIEPKQRMCLWRFP